jgi:diamine N-acetyltransferase
MPDVDIRRATLADGPVLAELSGRTFRETFLEDFAIPYPPADLAAFELASFGPDAWAERLVDERQATWLLEHDGRILGYANAGPCHLPHPEVRQEDGELYRLYVAREGQGRGLGVRLLGTVLQWMSAVLPGPQWLGVWSGNLRAQQLYAAHGFRRVGAYQFPVGAWLDDEFILRRD